MTQFYPQDAPNAIAFLLAWLAPLGPCGEKRWAAGDPVPYRMVTRFGGGANDMDMFADEALLSVHTFGNTVTQAQTEEQNTHRRIMVLIKDPSINVALADSSVANAAYIETTERGVRVDYADTTIQRVVSRYRISLEFVAA